MFPQSLRKRLFFGVAIVLAWFGFVIEGSHALFGDSAVLAGNTVSTGSTDLMISNSQAGSSTTYADSRPGFSINLSPGESEDHYVLLKNTSASDLALSISMSVTNRTGVDTMADAASISIVPVDSTGLPVGTPVSNKVVSWTNRPAPLDTVITKGQAQRYRITTSLAAAYSQPNQSFGYDLMFDGIQH